MPKQPNLTPVEFTIPVYDPVLKTWGDHIINRHYLVSDGRVKGKAAKLVIACHGGHGSAEKMLPRVPGRAGYVTVYPSGSDNGAFGLARVDGNFLSWHTYGPDEIESAQGWAGANKVNDELFLSSLIAECKARYGTIGTYGVGVSRGGMMVYHMSLALDAFDAVAGIATSITSGTKYTPSGLVPNLHIHGDDDHLVSWEKWYDTCAPWPQAKPLIAAPGGWQGRGEGHELHIVPNGQHAWDMETGFDTTGTVERFLDRQVA